MTVRDLIKELQECDYEMEVCISISVQNDACEIRDVYEDGDQVVIEG